MKQIIIPLLINLINGLIGGYCYKNNIMHFYIWGIGFITVFCAYDLYDRTTKLEAQIGRRKKTRLKK